MVAWWYQQVRWRLKNNSFIISPVAVKQGCQVSPTLFHLYIDQLEEFIAQLDEIFIGRTNIWHGYGDHIHSIFAENGYDPSEEIKVDDQFNSYLLWHHLTWPIHTCAWESECRCICLSLLKLQGASHISKEARLTEHPPPDDQLRWKLNIPFISLVFLLQKWPPQIPSPFYRMYFVYASIFIYSIMLAHQCFDHLSLTHLIYYAEQGLLANTLDKFVYTFYSMKFTYMLSSTK